MGPVVDKRVPDVVGHLIVLCIVFESITPVSDYEEHDNEGDSGGILKSTDVFLLGLYPKRLVETVEMNRVNRKVNNK